MSNLPSFAALLAGLPDDGDGSPTRKTPADVLCITLREVAERHAAPVAFALGDLVTPRSGGLIRGAGEPHIVIDVRPDAEPVFIGEPSSGIFGGRLNLRVACEHNGYISKYWVEAADFEPYTGPVASLDAEAA